MQKLVALALVFAAAPLGCGKDQTKAKTGPSASVDRSGGMTVADDESLPACDASRDGALVYVTSTKSFRSCGSGNWTTIDLTGAKGDKGDTGAAGAAGKAGADAGNATKAIAIYKQARKSVFRLEATCQPVNPYPSDCANGSTFLGTGFLCGDKEVCTNNHVVTCDAHCYTGITSLKMQALVGDSDSVNASGKQADPFFTASSGASFRIHPSKDLAIVPITANPTGAVPLTLSTKAAKDFVTELLPVLSMSFPLGFEDLYVDVGFVNSASITECNTEGGTSGYGCPKEFYSFSTTNDTDHGSSGSPLFDVATGEVIGVTTAGTENENANYTWASDASLYKDVP